MQQSDNYQQSFERILDAKRRGGDLIANYDFPHTCHRDVCNPENERMLIAKGLLSGPAMSNDVFVCRYGSQHICTELLCNNHRLGVCDISGACYGPQGGYSSYDKNDPKTWSHQFRVNEITAQSSATSNRQKRPYRRKTARHTDAIQDIIHKLLYSPIRKQVNDEKNARDSKQAETAILNYAKKCHDQRAPVSLIYVMMIQDNIRSTEQKLEIIEYDEKTVLKYVQIVAKISKIVQKYYAESFKIDVLALGVLYGMRQGYEAEQIVLLPSDTFLLYNLPTVNDLPSFGYEMRVVTRGKRLYEIAFKTALDRGVSVKEIAYTE